MDSDELRRRALEQLGIDMHHTSISSPKDMNTEELEEAFYQLQVHQAELHIQNQDLVQAQEELSELSDRYYALYDLAPVGYVTLGVGAEIVAANRAARLLLGIQGSKLPPARFADFLVPEDRPSFQMLISSVRENPRSRAQELRLTGSGTTVQVDAARFGDPRRVHLTLTDVSAASALRNQLNQALERNELLSRELHHRVMNSFNLLMSLADLQLARATEEDEDSRALHAFAGRLSALAKTHAALQRFGSSESVDLVHHLSSFLDDLTRGLFGTCKVSFTSKPGSLLVDSDSALYVSLIVNELVTNAVKYAYPDDGGEIRVSVDCGDDDMVTVAVSDDGEGMNVKKDTRRDGSLGHELVQTLAEGQLGGSWTVDSDSGTTHRISFPLHVAAI